ncbi:hypothetical protein EVAR_92711_1 [Eumeta japonica]|uniref:Uncharacterized protein n=1 Tax=Eumeta variegata TaxID=151549 RepID=A0A4C1SXY5_EUMVA|nr:hypothetical protein EVAR_92711_1 [Eumeta japonica]
MKGNDEHEEDILSLEERQARSLTTTPKAARQPRPRGAVAALGARGLLLDAQVADAAVGAVSSPDTVCLQKHVTGSLYFK